MRDGFAGILLVLVIAGLCGCGSEERTRIVLWHQMVVDERVVLDELVAEFERLNPDVRVQTLYKENEELRSGFQAAALAGTGPELIYGPSDPMGAYMTMGIVGDLSPHFEDGFLDGFTPRSLTWLADEKKPDEKMLVQIGDRVGNHLALVYNRNLIENPPQTTDELIALAIENTVDADGDGKPEQYGLVWNFIEPFFAIPFLTGHGAWVFEAEGSTVPALDTPESVAAMEFIKSLQSEHNVVPAGCDYETADALFKSGSAAMIINGDWSWGGYLSLETPDVDAVIAPLPVVSSTGIPMGPMVASKGYSLNVNVAEESVEHDAAIRFVEFMTSEPVQREFMTRLKTLPSRASLLDDPAITNDPTLLASAQQMQNGRAMPVAAELRAVWDSMRPPYQELMGGGISADEAAEKMQSSAENGIRLMNQQLKPDASVWLLRLIAAFATAGLIFWQRKSFHAFIRDWDKNRFAYFLIGPALLVIAATIIYPFFYNVVLSFSNMSLRNFQDWQVTGFQNYGEVFAGADSKFYMILLKTLIWTAVCVVLHVSLGLLLAVTLNGPVKGKAIYRVLLILPWAIPAYITALTWRGMFNLDYGAVNLIATKWFGLPAVNWLGEEYNALAACIITNVWLGVPFMMVIALGGMQGIPQELYEAARIDRVSRWKQFRHITLPMLKPVLLPAVTLGTIWTFNNLNVVWLVSNAGEPADDTHILVSYVYKAVFNLYQYGYGAALSMVIFFMLLIFSLLFLRKTKATEGVT
ncbi:MAG: extracellular solute-binding protein [Planctomycetota bacterium]